MGESEPNAKAVEFEFVRSPECRSILATGVWGGITPEGYILAGFFIDRPPVPQSVTHELTAEGVLGAEIDRRPRVPDRPKVERILQAEVLLTAETAHSLIEWLTAREKELQAVREPAHGGSASRGGGSEGV